MNAATDNVDPETTASTQKWRRPVLIGGAGIVVALLTAGTLVPGMMDGQRRSSQTSPTSATDPLQRWWVDGHGDVEALQRAVDDAQHGLTARDPAAIADACQRMHDVGELSLKARLPTPEPGLTADLSGAIEDSHAAAHMCLAVGSGTANNYSGEFRSDLDQAERQLRTAQDLVNESLADPGHPVRLTGTMQPAYEIGSFKPCFGR